LSNPIGVRLRNLVRPYSVEAMKDWIDWSRQAGLDTVDVPYLTEEIRDYAQQAGLKIGTFDVDDVAALFSRDVDKRNAASVSVRSQIKAAAQLGGSRCFMCLIPEDVSMPRAESFQLFLEVFPAILEEAEAAGVKIVLEGYPGPDPHYPTLGCTPEVLRAMIAAVPSPALCINYDPSHLVRLGVDPIRFLREFAGRIAHVHGKDCRVQAEDAYLYGKYQSAAFGQPIKYSLGAWRYTIPGEGETDWNTVAFELDRAGYDGPVCVELEDHRYAAGTSSQRNGIRKAAAYLRERFGGGE
jgi:sugar phosphate isomerase/epimerase